MADADPANMPSTQHERLYQRVDEVEEMPGKLWARWSEARLGGERAGARWSSRRQWRQLRLSFLPVSQTCARGRERLRASGRAGGRGHFDVDHGQRRQAGHGAWRPRGGNVLLLVGTVAQLKI
jgi:hypothetical protein